MVMWKLKGYATLYSPYGTSILPYFIKILSTENGKTSCTRGKERHEGQFFFAFHRFGRDETEELLKEHNATNQSLKDSLTANLYMWFQGRLVLNS